MKMNFFWQIWTAFSRDFRLFTLATVGNGEKLNGWEAAKNEQNIVIDLLYLFFHLYSCFVISFWRS